MAKRRPQGDGMVRKRSDGRWEARIVIGHKNDGTPMHKSVFGKTQKETLDKLHRAIETYRDVDLCEDSRMTLGEWLDKWLDEYMIFTLRESTMQSYRMIVNHYIKPHLGKKPLTSLTTADIQKLYNKLKKEGRVREDPIKGKTLADDVAPFQPANFAAAQSRHTFRVEKIPVGTSTITSIENQLCFPRASAKERG